MTTEKHDTRHNMPIFRDYTISEIASASNYSEAYLLQVRDGTKPLTRRMRHNLARDLNTPEDHLFSLPTPTIKAVEFTGGDDFAGTRFHKYCVRNQETKTGLYIGPYKEVEIEGGDVCAYCCMPITSDAPDYEEDYV